MPARRAKLLVLCKTYPSPSASYVETSCVAALEEGAGLVRLYPVPFRLMNDESQFKKWQWIEADIETASDDHRPESHRIRIDNLAIIGDPVPTRNDWSERRYWLDRLVEFQSFGALEAARIERRTTLALLKPGRILGLDIVKGRAEEWTPDELAKLEQAQRQGSLFAESENQALTTLRKIPHDFYYRYTDPDGTERRHKIVDWEAGALYWRVLLSHGADWERPFRQKLEKDLVGKDLMFLMGTIHRFPDQWLIVSLIYPPKRLQQSLL